MFFEQKIIVSNVEKKSKKAIDTNKGLKGSKEFLR